MPDTIAIAEYTSSDPTDVVANFLAHAGTEVIGWVRVRPRELPYGQTSTRRYAEITELFVEAEHRRSGVATALVGEALAWARRHDLEWCSVETSAREGSPGAPTYTALGFAPQSIIYDIHLS